MQVQEFQVSTSWGLLTRTGATKQVLANSLTPIMVLAKSTKDKWKPVGSATPGDSSSSLLVWHELVGTSQVKLPVSRWIWQGTNQSLLDFHSAHVYWRLVRKDSPRAREPLPPSWQRPLNKQERVLKLLWHSPGVSPKLAALGWRLAQRALPNTDRWVGLLEIFDYAYCQKCEGEPRNTSEHSLYSCSSAKPVWQKVGNWISSHQEHGALPITEEMAMLGIRSRGNRAVPYRKEQWWPILWLATLFEWWKSWSGEVYGGKTPGSQEAILCRIWERWVVAGMAMAWRTPRRFANQESGSRLERMTKRWLLTCPWARPHHGSGSQSQGMSPS